jgi:hypothetical protein
MLHWYSRIRTSLFAILLATQFREAGFGSRISTFRCHGLNQIMLGRDVQIERNCWVQALRSHSDEEARKIIIKSHADI